MTLSPFDNPVPNEYMQKIEDYARDLAWGVTQEHWGVNLVNRADLALPLPSQVEFGNEQLDLSDAAQPVRDFFRKWLGPEALIERTAAAPKSEALIFWEYVRVEYEARPPIRNAQGNEIYVPPRSKMLLTRAAFDLLKKPLDAPQVFISYRRATSSLLALAIEARLRLVGHHNVFVDKDIEAGDDWLDTLEQKIKACDYFVVLVDQQVFESPWMVREYELASTLGKTIIPITHPGVDITTFDDAFSSIQIIECRGKTSAASYEDAINRLLNRLGYPTY